MNVVTGQNAQGKSNLLEAVSLCAGGRSFRTAHSAEMIAFGMNSARVTGCFADGELETEVRCEMPLGRAKAFFENGSRLKKFADISAPVSAVSFTPDDLELVKRGASYRMGALDAAISRLRPRFAESAGRLARLLREKQHILKNAQSEPENFGLLPVINNSLVEVGADIVFFRAAYLARLEQTAAEYQKQASSGAEALTLEYVSHGLPQGDSGRAATREEIAASLAAHQRLRYDAEVASGRVLSGAARDDYTAQVGGVAAKGFASQGQTRTIALCLKLSERDIAADVLGAPPILLLDDVLSELDDSRRGFVLENTGGGQVIITTAGSDVFSRSAAVIHAQSGCFTAAQ